MHQTCSEREREREREGNWEGAEQERGGTGGDNGSCLKQRLASTEGALDLSCWMYLRAPFSHRRACAAQQLTCDFVDGGGSATELCAVGKNFLFSYLA